MTYSPINAAPALTVPAQDGADKKEELVEQHLMQVREMAASSERDYSDDQEKAEE